MTTIKSSSQTTRVCVIGAGVCGLVSVKACLDAGFEVSCYDKSSDYGGLWCYRDDKKNPTGGEFTPSVMKTTILNTSKELSAFSDFPPPENSPNFMKHDLYMDYIRSYVEHFKILPRLELQHEILHCQPELNSNTGEVEWLVDIKDMREAPHRVFRKTFDKLMVAIGHHNIPFTPSFPGQHKFKGQILHTIRVKDILSDQRFIDKRVLVVGLGNSACDAANDLALVSKKCYVSCHRGNWFSNRMSSTGLQDFEQKRKFNYYKQKYLPQSMNDRRLRNIFTKRTNHQLLGLTPKHKPSELAPATNDLFPFRVFTGGVTMKAAVSCFTEDGVVFEGEEDCEYKIDVVILGTGYLARVSFLNEFELGLKTTSDQHEAEYNLFLNIFAPNLSVPIPAESDEFIEKQISRKALKSFAFIGLVQPSGSITVISELQARLVALVFAGKCELPSMKEMLKHIQTTQAQRSSKVRSHSRDQIVGNWIGYLEDIAGRIGVKPNMSRLFFKDFPLWKELMFGPNVPYQYRLIGPGSWDKARETILTVDERVYQGINEGKNHILFETRRKCLRESRKPTIKNLGNDKPQN